MTYTLIDARGQYALILRGESMTQYAVVCGLDKEPGSWDWTCCYYDFGEFSDLTKAEALFKAVDYYLMRTDENHICWARMSEIATLLKDGLSEDDEDEAYRYMVDVDEFSDAEAEYFGLDMEQFKSAMGENADSSTSPSSAGGDYSPANPWDAPGMSASEFIQVSR